MVYAQFYQRAVWPVGTDRIIEGTGDRSVVILDGRNTRETWERIAKQECAKRGYVAWSLHKGEAFSRSKPLTLVTLLG